MNTTWTEASLDPKMEKLCRVSVYIASTSQAKGSLAPQTV